MNRPTEADDRLERLLAAPPLLADRGFTRRVTAVAARRRRVRHATFLAAGATWAAMAGLLLSADTLARLEEQLVAWATRIALPVMQLDVQEGLLAGLPPMVVSALTLPGIVPLAILALSVYALLSVQLRV